MASSSQTDADAPHVTDTSMTEVLAPACPFMPTLTVSNAQGAPAQIAVPFMPTLTVSNGLDSLGHIAVYVVQAAKTAGITGRRSYRLRLAVDEIATNIFTHGYPDPALQGSIVVSAALTPEALQITLDDTGIAYNPLSHPQPQHLNLALHEREPGGLGIYLALRYVDQFCYARVGDHNYNTFIVNRLSEAEPADG